ncbi:MAG: hypothetical protein KJ600_03195 [Nanoarchaeota archaeon]|nr:hypothetical protein [Nanoarchaeota archaeon]MBU1103533.1 hypothetical protein [Nanoarchaeota archaeon]
MKKILGYILAVAGLVGVAAWAVKPIRQAIPEIGQFGEMPLIAVSIALAVIGIFMVVRSGSFRKQKSSEVPIYQGKNVVGYRRD